MAKNTKRRTTPLRSKPSPALLNVRKRFKKFKLGEVDIAQAVAEVKAQR